MTGYASHHLDQGLCALVWLILACGVRRPARRLPSLHGARTLKPIFSRCLPHRYINIREINCLYACHKAGLHTNASHPLMVVTHSLSRHESSLGGTCSCLPTAFENPTVRSLGVMGTILKFSLRWKLDGTSLSQGFVCTAS